MRMASSASWVTTMQVARVSCRMASVSSRMRSRKRRIEAGEGLVHEKHARPRRDGSGKRHALLLTAGEDMRVFVGVMVEPDAGERGKRLAFASARVSERSPKATFCRMERWGKSAKS